MNCYAILRIPDGYLDDLESFIKYKLEFFDVDAAGFDSTNVEGLIAYFINVLKISNFELHWSILDPDHFKEFYYLEEYEVF